MAVAFDAVTRFPTVNSEAVAGDRTFTHTPSGTPKGVVLVLPSQNTNSGSPNSILTGVLYGGVAMTMSAAGVDTIEGPGRVEIWTLTSGVPTGAQTVTLQGCNTDNRFCTCATVTASADTVVDTFATADTQTSTDPQLNLTLGATALTFGGLFSGEQSVLASPLTGCTSIHNRDYGNQIGMTGRRSSPDAAGSVTFGWTNAISEDWGMAAVAIAEAGGAPPPAPRTLALLGAGA